MLSLAPLLILTALATPTTGDRLNDAVPIYHCDFQQQFGQPCDVNYDDWPDHWQRETGPGYPHYINIRLFDDEQATAGRRLTIESNGGNAEVASPSIAVSSKYAYLAETRLRVEGMQFAQARLALEFCDEDLRVLRTEKGPWVGGTEGWQRVTLGPVNIDDPDIELVRLRLILREGDRVDLQGTASLDEVWIARLPKLTVRTNSPFNVYTDPNDVRVTCELSGVQERNPNIRFELIDANGKQLSDEQVRLEGRLISNRAGRAADLAIRDADQPAGFAGGHTWPPPIKEPGFYRVRVTMMSARGTLDRRLINLAVAPPLARPALGEFGWSLAGAPVPLEFDQLEKLLPLVSVNWVKLPVWSDGDEEQTGDKLVNFTEKLAAHDVEVVGVIDHPSPDSHLAKLLLKNDSIADALSINMQTWLPLLDPILTRLSLRVRWWQLGDDHDVSYAGFPQLEQEITRIRQQLFRFGQDVRLGFGWNWLKADDTRTPATWEFQQYSAEPALTGTELGHYLNLPARAGMTRWVLIEPLPAETYNLQTRARDLVDQMIAAKIFGADAAFAAKPFDEKHGLMTPRGTPGELLLPWRTTSTLLSGSTFLGTLELPGGSKNRLFETPEGDVLMIVWNGRTTREVIHLGDDVRVVDVWGRQTQPGQDGRRQVIEVGPMPTFVRGLNPYIARWRIGTQLTAGQVPSVFGMAHPNSLEFRNEFPQGAGGTIRIAAPDGWQIGPEILDFKLAVDSADKKRFTITLPLDANSGGVPIRADFTVNASRTFNFSVYRKIKVGDGLVDLEVHSRLAEDGKLVVEQRMVNHGGNLVDFKCLLYAPGRRRQRTQVFRLGPNEDVKTYHLSRGAELIGKEIWLRAEEVDGIRVLNHRFRAEK